MSNQRARKLGGVLYGAVLLTCGISSLWAQSSEPSGPQSAPDRALLDRIEKLEKRVAVLEARSTAGCDAAPTSTTGASASDPPAPQSQPALTQEHSALSFVSGATLNFYLDGYYGYNWNRPLGRVNLLRANDSLSNNFTLNQATVILERAPDPTAGRRLGGRVDLMFGENTEIMQGSPVNEPRPQAFRNIFQAYGTYILPIGSGLTIDFGKFASALGIENNYAYEDLNYSRSFYFTFLPFYHMGVRSTYNLNDKLSIQYWLVNGANQTEDFNSYKSNAFLFTVKPAKRISWNLNYYFGDENRDLTPYYNPGLPALPTQPGLSTTPAPGPSPNGKTHIFDTYATWTVTPKTTLAAESDYVVSRLLAGGPAAHALGGAGNAQHQVTDTLALAARFEYLADHGGLFSGLTQDLKEDTFTATYQPADGFQIRLEYRRDDSNQPFFLTATPGILMKHQNTAAIGLIWWYGAKRESW